MRTNHYVYGVPELPANPGARSAPYGLFSRDCCISSSHENHGEIGIGHPVYYLVTAAQPAVAQQPLLPYQHPSSNHLPIALKHAPERYLAMASIWPQNRGFA